MRLPKSAPPVLIVQHMPAPFMSLFAKHLDNVCPLHVVEAMDRQELKPGTAYVAAGDHHLLIEPAGHPTIAQDERSCTVFGMPREAIRRGGAGQVVGLDHMAKAIFDNLDRHRPVN